MDYEYDAPRRSRRSSGGWFWYFIIIAAVGGGIYYVWGMDGLPAVKKVFEGGNFPEIITGAAKKTPDTVKGLQDKTETIIKSTLDFLTNKPKEVATNIATDVVKTATESVQKEAAQILGLPTAGIGAIPSNVSIVRPVRQNLSLLIDAEKEGLEYTIDWGDKQKTNGSLAPKEQKTIDHTWSDAGEYAVKVLLNGKELGQQSFSFPMTIVK